MTWLAGLIMGSGVLGIVGPLIQARAGARTDERRRENERQPVVRRLADAYRAAADSCLEGRYGGIPGPPLDELEDALAALNPYRHDLTDDVQRLIEQAERSDPHLAPSLLAKLFSDVADILNIYWEATKSKRRHPLQLLCGYRWSLRQLR